MNFYDKYLTTAMYICFKPRQHHRDNCSYRISCKSFYDLYVFKRFCEPLRVNAINCSRKFLFPDLQKKLRTKLMHAMQNKAICRDSNSGWREGLFSSFTMNRFVCKFSGGGYNGWRSTTALWVSRNNTFFDNAAMSLSIVNVSREFNSPTLGYSMTPFFWVRLFLLSFYFPLFLALPSDFRDLWHAI